jgi:hypothetical protein
MSLVSLAFLGTVINIGERARNIVAVMRHWPPNIWVKGTVSFRSVKSEILKMRELKRAFRIFEPHLLEGLRIEYRKGKG